MFQFLPGLIFRLNFRYTELNIYNVLQLGLGVLGLWFSQDGGEGCGQSRWAENSKIQPIETVFSVYMLQVLISYLENEAMVFVS